MEQKMMISGSISIKTKLWTWLLAGSILLSACSSEITIQDGQELEGMSIENPDFIIKKISGNEQEEESSNGNLKTYQKGEYGEQS